MPVRVLIIGDEEPLGALLQRMLETEGYEVRLADRGDEADRKLQEWTPDVLILDWQSPHLCEIGLSRWSHIRPGPERMPLIVLAACGTGQHCTEAIAMGADDCLTNSIDVEELLARFRTVLRRTKPSYIMTTLRADDIELDRVRLRVKRGNREIHLGPTEFRLLEFLMQTPGRPFSRQQLLDAVWARRGTGVGERAVDVHIGRLRKAINIDNRPDPIRTVRGTGYAFKEEDHLRPDGSEY